MCTGFVLHLSLKIQSIMTGEGMVPGASLALMLASPQSGSGEMNAEAL